MEMEQESSLAVSPLYDAERASSIYNPPLATQIGFRPATSEPFWPVPLVRFLVTKISGRIWAFCGSCQANGSFVPQPRNATYVVVFPMFFRHLWR
jgi:hypothetical protein